MVVLPGDPVQRNHFVFLFDRVKHNSAQNGIFEIMSRVKSGHVLKLIKPKKTFTAVATIPEPQQVISPLRSFRLFIRSLLISSELPLLWEKDKLIM